jgi:N-acetylmuramoyl-L-alanine amidase
MKNIFKVFTIVILTFALFRPMQMVVKASTYIDMGPKNDVVVSKPWTVSFNKPLSPATVTTTNIKVVGENNNYIDVNVSLANDNKKVIVSPVNNYEANKSYTLIVTDKVISNDGTPLPKEVRMTFHTKSAPDITQISSVGDIKVDLQVGSTYVFPKTVQAITSNNAAKDVAVQWIQNSVYLNAVGTYTYEGIIENYDKKVKVIINVTKKTYKVVIDPGHGGNDPGAVGTTLGTQEKAIVLQISLKIGNILTKNGVDVIYTRAIDKTQSLQEKCDVSNNAEPYYFVSIHANAYSVPTVSGIETFYFAGNVAGQNLAQAVQTELIKATGRFNRGIKTAGYYVLNNTNATAILVETSFLTNPAEERLLVTDAYQNKLALAISTGILKSLGITNIVP